jgi:hypothetical protein
LRHYIAQAGLKPAILLPQPLEWVLGFQECFTSPNCQFVLRGHWKEGGENWNQL